MARKRLLKMKSEMTQKHLESTTPRPNQHWKSFLQQFDDFDRLHSFSQPHPKSQSPAPAVTDWTLPRRVQSGNFKAIGAFAIDAANTKDNVKFTKADPKSKFRELRNRILKKDFKKFHFLNNKFNSSSTLAETITERRKLKRIQYKKKSSAYLRRFVGAEKRGKRSLKFADSKDHYFTEQKYKVSKGVISRKNTMNKISVYVIKVIDTGVGVTMIKYFDSKEPR